MVCEKLPNEGTTGSFTFPTRSFVAVQSTLPYRNNAFILKVSVFVISFQYYLLVVEFASFLLYHHVYHSTVDQPTFHHR